ncbi:hypothetical protein IVB18_12210 [Bradyrhizobium sp. 186]|uniref:hypothetical protein n=1 Tax=Bradyrhizobium sp. 186 TaxID=2782654 RepID=UPI0020016A66|nr:hypothetical protein [Bradyrhizobium sp. 186]UPK37985.1 hypothetical protein IVB18_12210 [Bradyrhizobium sp. 186]
MWSLTSQRERDAPAALRIFSHQRKGLFQHNLPEGGHSPFERYGILFTDKLCDQNLSADCLTPFLLAIQRLERSGSRTQGAANFLKTSGKLRPKTVSIFKFCANCRRPLDPSNGSFAPEAVIRALAKFYYRSHGVFAKTRADYQSSHETHLVIEKQFMPEAASLPNPAQRCRLRRAAPSTWWNNHDILRHDLPIA